jgi:hypothetical protein
LVALLASAIGRTVRWRGIDYRLNQDAQVIEVAHHRGVARTAPQRGRTIDVLRLIA